MSDWMRQAACRAYPSEWWFPVSGEQSKQVTPKAKAVCKTCPILDQCRTESRRIEDTEGRFPGLWAGETAKERAKRPLPPQQVQCVECQTRFETKSRLARFCTRACRQRAYNRQTERDRNPQEHE